jgi:hypothetical protein
VIISANSQLSCISLRQSDKRKLLSKRNARMTSARRRIPIERRPYNFLSFTAAAWSITCCGLHGMWTIRSFYIPFLGRWVLTSSMLYDYAVSSTPTRLTIQRMFRRTMGLHVATVWCVHAIAVCAWLRLHELLYGCQFNGY